MNRDDARDLLPLYAGGDLDDEAHAALAAVLTEDADLAGECAAWEELDTMLTDALSPAEESTEPDWGALLARPEEPAAPVVVRRHCPYCKDDLPSEAVVFCAACATPHHEPCFAENQGCSLLGCGGVESVTLDSARRQICTACTRTTPADAPYCAWCGATFGEAALRPRHEQVTPLPAPPSWRPLLAAASLLLGLGLGVGGLFGLQQVPMIEELNTSIKKTWSDSPHSLAEHDARLFLAEVEACQRLYREHDLDRNGAFDLAPDLETLTRVVRAAAAKRGGAPDELLVLGDRKRWTIKYRVSPDGKRFAVLLLPGQAVVENEIVTWYARPLLLAPDGTIRAADGATDIDPKTLESDSLGSPR